MMEKLGVVTLLVIVGFPFSSSEGIEADNEINCMWSSCENLLFLEEYVCSLYKNHVPSGRLKFEGCDKPFTMKSECCVGIFHISVKTWTPGCYGQGVKSVHACRKAFGHGFLASGEEKACKDEVGKRHVECYY